MEGEDSGIDKDDVSADDEITSDPSSGQSFAAYDVVIEWQRKVPNLYYWFYIGYTHGSIVGK